MYKLVAEICAPEFAKHFETMHNAKEVLTRAKTLCNLKRVC